MSRLAYLVSFLLIVSSCVETITLDSNEEQPVVVYCILQDSDTQSMDLFYAKGKSQSDYQPVTDATVELFCGEEKVAEFTKSDGVKWSSPFKPEYGKTYQLVISIQGSDSPITAVTRMPDRVDVDCWMKRRWYNGSDFTYIFYSYEIRTHEMIAPWQYDTKGKPYSPYNLWIFSKKGKDIITSHPYADRFNVTQTTIEDLSYFSDESQRTWTKNWLKMELFGWIPSFCKDFPAFSNFVRISAPENFSNGFTDDETNNLPYYSPVSFILLTDYEERDADDHYLGKQFDCYFLSEELDAYCKQLYTKTVLNKDSFLSVFDTENLYTNLNGAFGIFGAVYYTEDKNNLRGYKDDFLDPDRPYDY